MSQLRVDIHWRNDRGFQLQLEHAFSLKGVTGIFGPSGSGKTTLLRCIAGLERLQRGSIVCDGTTWAADARQTPAHRRNIGYVFQDARLFAHLTVRDNLVFAQRRRRQLNGPSYDEVVDWLALPPLLEQRADQLSAGQQQRVALARALLNAPALLLMDEALGNLDQPAKRQILPKLRQLYTRFGIPFLYVSHHMAEIEHLAEDLVLLDQGRLAAAGSVRSLSHRLDLLWAQDEDAALFLACQFSHQDDSHQLSALRVGGSLFWINRIDPEPNQTLSLRIQARDVSLCLTQPHDSSILNILPVTVKNLANAGPSQVLAELDCHGQPLLARITRKSCEALGLAAGSRVFAQVKASSLFID